jgi:hypothetical protein
MQPSRDRQGAVLQASDCFRISLSFLCFAAACLAQSLTLNRLVVGPPAAQGRSKIFISTTGTPDPHARWKLSARKTKAAAPITVAVTNVVWYPNSSTVALEFDSSVLPAHDPRRYGWTAVYNDLLTVSLAPPEEWFGVPRSRDDADLYLFGSFLAGVSTKPLYAIDASMRWLPEIRNSGYFLGVSSTVAINSSSTLPQDRTRADPDAIAAALTLRFMKRDFLFDVEPAKGEFSRFYPASSFVPSATVKWVRDPLFSTKRHAAVFYPYAGIEAGSNLNHPRTFLGQPATLSSYGGIGRILLRGYGAYYISKQEPDNDDPYLFEFYVDYTARLLFTDEPLVTSGSVLRLNSDPRQYTEAGLAWNVSKHVGLETKYRHGSLPPMFEFVDHQVSIGVTFKTKLPSHF